MTNFTVTDKRFGLRAFAGDASLTTVGDFSASYVAGYANYKGDIRADIVGQLAGPTTYGRLVVATSATYDPEKNRTRVQFSFPADDDN